MSQKKIVRLGDVCKQDRATVKTGERTDLQYIGLESIEAHSGRFNNRELSKTPEAPQANSFRFGTEHVLYGKLRPYLNKVALADFEGKCSTEIIPLLPSPELDRRYLGYFLRSPLTVSRISDKTAGARMPRADMDFIFGLEMSLPSISEQRRIVDILSRAEGIVQLRREAEKKAAELIPALFLDMFGDPVKNPKGLPSSSLGELCDVKGGGTPSKQNQAFWIGEIPWVSPKDMSGTYLIEDAEDHISPNALKNSATNLIPIGSILIVTRSGVLKHTIPCAITAREVAINQDIKAFVPRKEVVPYFLFSQIQVRTKEILGLVRVGATVQNIETEALKRMRCIYPSLDAQIKFSEKCEQIRSIQSQQTTATAKAKATFDALLAQVFN